jgi:hypothetical protein
MSQNQPSGPSLQAIPELEQSMDGMYSTVSALVQTVRALAGQTPRQSSGARPAQKSNTSKTQQTQKKENTGRFTEQSRVTSTVKITNPQDDTQYVMVKQITQLIMVDNVTGEQWVWTL